MELRLVTEGAAHTIYSMELGETLHGFLADLRRNDLKEHDRILARLDRLAECGASRRKDEFNSLGGGLYEAKTSRGSRVVFFYDDNRIVVCTHGFSKQSQRTPRQLLNAARERKAHYEQARRAGENITIRISATQDKPKRMP